MQMCTIGWYRTAPTCWQLSGYAWEQPRALLPTGRSASLGSRSQLRIQGKIISGASCC